MDKPIIIYGSIIRIVTYNNTYNDILFFVNNINEQFIELVSNNGMERHVFNLTEDLQFEDKNIKEVLILHTPDKGFAEQNGLIPNKKIKILFKNGSSSEISDDGDSLTGEITELEKDMITITLDDGTKMYLDFNFSGIHPKYNIEKITILQDRGKNASNVNQQQATNNDFFIELKEENKEKIKQKLQEDGFEYNDEQQQKTENANENNEHKLLGYIENTEDEFDDFMMIYSIEQQIDDYVEYCYKRKIHKSIVDVDIRQYTELLDLYVNLQEGKRILTPPSDQVAYSMANNSFRAVYPVTSYGYKNFYLNSEEEIARDLFPLSDIIDKGIEEQTNFSILLNSNNKLDNEITNEEFYTNDNVLFSRQPHGTNMKKYRSLNPIQQIYLIENQTSFTENKNNYYGISGRKSSKQLPQFQSIPSYHTTIQPKLGSSIYIDGFIFPNKDVLDFQMNQYDSQNILNKHYSSTLFPYALSSAKVVEKKKLPSSCDVFDKNNMVYIPFRDNQTSLSKYFKDLDIKISDIYKCFMIKNESSYYQYLKKLGFFGINHVTKEIHSEIHKNVRQNSELLKRNIIRLRRELISSVNENPFHINLNEQFYPIIIDNYNIVNSDRKSETELLDKAIIDNYELLMFNMIRNNDKLFMDFSDDDELSQLIEEINDNIQALLQDNKKLQRIPVVKKYASIQEMMNDTNKIILKDHNVKYSNPYEYLYGYLIKQFNYNESNETFMNKLIKILRSNDLQNSDHSELFESNTIYENLILQLIEMKVNPNDRCYVEGTNSYYVYNGNSWEKESSFTEKIKKRKVLQIRNREESFDELKENIISNYVIELVNRIQTEQSKKEQLKDFQDITIMKRRKEDNLKQIRKQQRFHLIKYDSMKQELANELQKSDYIEHVDTSPYLKLFHYIIQIDDMDDKYTLITKFINELTIDNNDKYWYYCIKTNTKLVPKYIHRLASAYLTYNTHEETLKQICKEEGTISENGTEWVHIESGYTLRKIDFDTSLGFDENGNVIQTSEVIIQDDDELFMEEDDIDIDELEELAVPSNLEKQRYYHLSDYEKELQHLLLSFMQILGLSFHPEDNQQELVKEIGNIMKFSASRNKQNKHNVHVLYVYCVLGFLLSYVQSRGLQARITFPGCTYSLEGFPLTQDTASLGGIIYFSCVLKQLKNPNEPYKSFRDKTKEEISEELFNFIQSFVLKNQFVQNILIARRNYIMKFGVDFYKEPSFLRPPERFRPILYDIKTTQMDDLEILPNDELNYQNILRVQNYLHYLSIKLQESISELMKTQKPLLTTRYEQPFLINFCCNTNKYILEFIADSSKQKSELSGLFSLIHQNEFVKKEIFTNIMKVPGINIQKLKPTTSLLTPSISSLTYDEQVIYTFFIKTFNFDNELPIPNYLLKFEIDKPGREIYNPLFDLSQKIKILNENGFLFTHELMIDVLKHKAEYITKINSTNKTGTDELTQPREKVIDKVVTIHKRSKETFKIFEDEVLTKPKVESYFEDKTQEYIDAFRIYTQQYNSSQMKYLNKVLQYIEYDIIDRANISKINQFIYNLNYFLIHVFSINLSTKYRDSSIICKHWSLANEHNTDIKTQQQKFMNLIPIIDELPSNYVELLDVINSHKDIQRYDEFRKSDTMQFLFQKYLLFYVLNLFIAHEPLLHSSTQLTRDFDEKIIQRINKSLVEIMFTFMKNTRIDYNDLLKRRNQTKQSEKLIKTDYFKNMRHEERQAEKMKMNLKLGVWGFALDGSRVYKYNKSNYSVDKDEASEVQDIVKKMYYEQSDDMNPYEGLPEENKETDEIAEEESYGLSMLPEDDDYGENMDGDEMYY